MGTCSAAAPAIRVALLGLLVSAFGLLRLSLFDSRAESYSRGPTSLFALSSGLGEPVSYAGVRQLFGAYYRECSLLDIEIAAARMGLDMDGVLVDLHTLRRLRPRAILHLRYGRFVAALAYSPEDVLVADPQSTGSYRLQRWPYALLASRWDGAALIAVCRGSLGNRPWQVVSGLHREPVAARG
jgi:ABC-type bacteriocin/lantibiotic exporter with double-glycine peptidase domain